MIAIVLAWVGFVLFSAGGFLYAYSRLKKNDNKWSRKPKNMLGSLPNQPPTQMDLADKTIQVSIFTKSLRV